MRYLILPLVLTCLEAQAATVVVDTNISLLTPGTLGEYDLTVQQDPVFDLNPTSIFLDHNGQDLTFVTFNADEGSDWYLASLGDSFSTTTIEEENFVPFALPLVSWLGRTTTVGFGEFYMGVNTGEGRMGNMISRDVFGWAKFRNTPSGLELLESAVAYQTDGIIIGTTTTIPEPSTLLIVISGVCLIVQRKCSKMTRRGVY